MLFSKVESISVEEDLIGRWLGYGLAVVKGTGGTPERFKNVASRKSLEGRSSKQNKKSR